MRTLFLSVFCSLLLGEAFAQSRVLPITIDYSKVEGAWYGIRLEATTMSEPSVTLSNQKWAVINALSEAALKDISRPVNALVRMGTERKQPFVIIQLPVYKYEDGKYWALQSLDLDLKTAPAYSPSTNNTAARGTATNAVLSSGSFYKIAVHNRGIYKVDYNFLKTQLGITPENYDAKNLRLYGNGGVVHDESNASYRPADLVDNAILMVDGGDGKINSGDYFLFYANGPIGWRADTANKQFYHRTNLYEDSSFYFLTFDHGPGARITTQASINNPTHTVNAYNDYALHELDVLNIGKFGKIWWGNEMSAEPGKTTTQNLSFNTDGIIDSLSIKTRVACVSEVNAASSTISVSLNGNPLFSGNLGAPDDYTAGRSEYWQAKLPFTGSSANFQYSLLPATNITRAYIDFVQINYRKALRLYGSQNTFRDFNSVGMGHIASYQIANANANTRVWDITDPLAPIALQGTLQGSTYVVNQVAGTLREFVTFDGSGFHTPVAKGPVSNSNLHGQPFAKYLIITHPQFAASAERLADFHRKQSNLTVNVAKTNEIFNEFGSGSKDIGAMRDYIKMFYDRAGNDTQSLPRYVLLFGDASYDYKNRTKGNTNFVPTHEATESLYGIDSYCDDDFFTYLDENENIEDYSIINLADVGIGRLPVGTEDEAEDVVNKILAYKSPASLGKWRLSPTMLGDNKDDAGNHLLNTDAVGNIIEAVSPIFTNNKIYLDNLPFVNTPSGDRCPQGSKDLTTAVSRGTFLINYAGHGGPTALAHERVLTQDVFNSWTNYNKLPFMITATCDFSQFDKPEKVSAGEQLIIKNNGGAIAMLTTTHAVFAGQSSLINELFIKTQFQHTNNHWRSYGDALREAKNTGFLANPNAFFYINTHKFTLLGDPALTPNFPRYNAVTDSMKDISGGYNLPTDSIKALGQYHFFGSIRNDDGSVLNNFNGTVDITIYDKRKKMTIPYKNNSLDTARYQLWENIVYRGKVSVTGGKFSYTFIAPKDINYDFGKGKLVYYAQNGNTDAAGFDTSIVIGGFSRYPIQDDAPPIVKAYIGDSLFINGSITGTNTSVFAIISDESGINVSGSSIGHDLVAVLDGDENNPYLMNDYYETEANNYKRGYVKFPVEGIADGKHYFIVRAWDVNNNSGEGRVDFEVVNGKVVKIGKLINYPNPFANETKFLFEHNHPGEKIDLTLRIFNTLGQQLKKINTTIIPETSRTELSWDGTADNNTKLGSGVYPYAIELKTKDGAQAVSYQKLVITR